MALLFNVIDQVVSGELSCTQTVPVFCEAQNKSEMMTLCFIMTPTSEKLRGHIGLGLSVCLSVCLSVILGS